MIFGAKPYGNIITDGLVLNLDATNPQSYPGTGSTWFDTSGYNKTNAIQSSVIYTQERGRGSMAFNGTTAYTLGNTAALSNTSNCTLEINCKFASLSNYASLLYIGHTQFNHNLPYIALTAFSSNLYFSANYTNGGSRLTYNAVSSITANAWHCCTGTMGNGALNLYIDGVYKSSYTLPANFVADIGGLPLYVYGGVALSPYISGSVSAVRVYNRALTSDEVLQNYNALKSRFV